ncbi:MAG: HAMP domain-containing protein [Anaerolineae bacterium]|nr:HAMP domain-containing protein [Anaerolineae bacterium]
MKEPHSQKNFFQHWWQGWGRRFLNLNIRLKIIGPFLILTFIVAVLGIYVVTRLVFQSLDERLTNHAVEAGRVVSNNLARQEITHQEAARLIAFTEGFADALESGDLQQIESLALPHAMTKGVEWLLVADAQGRVRMHFLEQDGRLQPTSYPVNAREISIIAQLLEAAPTEFSYKHALGKHPVDEGYYYFTSVTVQKDDRFVGVLAVGTSLETLLPRFKRNALADVTIYLDDGRAIASTLTGLTASPDATTDLLSQLNLTPELYRSRLENPDLTRLEDIQILGMPYRLATGSLYIEEDALGVFSVAFPTDYILTTGEASRNSYFLIILFAAIAVIAVGYLIAQRIIVPLQKLTSTALVVADGDLDRRTGIVGTDEIGVLAGTFDYMTAKLAIRNAELRDALRAQRELSSRLRAILSSIGDGVLMEDLSQKIEPANDAAKSMLKTMVEHFALGPLRELAAGKDWKDDLKIENPWLLESRRFQVGDKVFSAHSAAVETDNKEKLGTVIVLRDITAEVEAEQLKDAFVEHVSHELRTPLTSIKGYSSLLLATAGESLNPQQHVFLKTIVTQAENLTTMVNALLDFSEMQASGRLGIRPQTMNLAELVGTVTDEWRPKFEEKSLQFEVEIEPDIPSIDGDSKRLHWALTNLIRNAHQYTSEGKVTVKLSRRDGYAVVDVADTGIGIAPDSQRRIFSRFYRVMNVSDDLVRGLGLGLYVSKAIIDAHRGRLRLVSQEGAGSTFTFELPLPHISDATLEA